MKYDVAVVGASSAGLFVAERLARGGVHVAVFDRAEEVTPPRRTLIITPEINRLLGKLPESLILNRTAVIAIESLHAEVQVALADPDLIVERSALASYLEWRAREAGASLFLGHRFEAIEPNEGGARLSLRISDGQRVAVDAAAIIGADGAFSRVATETGIPPPATVPILQAEVQLPRRWDPSTTKVWFDVDDTRFFYWLVPESPQRGVVGLIGDGRPAMRRKLERFLGARGIEPLAYQGARIAMHRPRLRPWSRIGSAPVLLVGDAAGQVKVTTVGGTITGLWGAEAAAQSLLSGRPYARALRSLKRELEVHWTIRHLLDRLDNRGYDRLVRAVSPGVSRFLATNNRDSIGTAMWKFPYFEFRLLMLGLGLVVGGHKARPALRLDRLDA